MTDQPLSQCRNGRIGGVPNSARASTDPAWPGQNKSSAQATLFTIVTVPTDIGAYATDANRNWPFWSGWTSLTDLPVSVVDSPPSWQGAERAGTYPMNTSSKMKKPLDISRA